MERVKICRGDWGRNDVSFSGSGATVHVVGRCQVRVSSRVVSLDVDPSTRGSKIFIDVRPGRIEMNFFIRNFEKMQPT